MENATVTIRLTEYKRLERESELLGQLMNEKESITIIDRPFESIYMTVYTNEDAVKVLTEKAKELHKDIATLKAINRNLEGRLIKKVGFFKSLFTND